MAFYTIYLLNSRLYFVLDSFNKYYLLQFKTRFDLFCGINDVINKRKVVLILSVA